VLTPFRASTHKKGKTMNNKTKGVIAGIAGLALLGGGTTFALWSDSDTISGATITNGQLSVDALGAMVWTDESSDVSGSPEIDLDTFRMVPGDSLQGSQSLDVVVEGNNLVADLLVDTAAATVPADVEVTYDVLRGSTVLASDVALGTDTPLTDVASGTYTVVVNVDFDYDAEGSMDDTTALQDITVSLTQDR